MKKYKYAREGRIRFRIRCYFTETGSFTLETTLIFPLIFIFLLLLMTLSLVQYQLSGQYFATIITADRTAHNWEVINRQFVTGEYEIGAKRDNLYWRVSDENIFKGLILSREADDVRLPTTIADKIGEQSTSNPIISQATDILATNYNATVMLDTGLFKQIKIKTVAKPVTLLPARTVESTNLAVSGYSFVSEPDEFIRLVNLIVDFR